jgi:hypothetical protein
MRTRAHGGIGGIHDPAIGARLVRVAALVGELADIGARREGLAGAGPSSQPSYPFTERVFIHALTISNIHHTSLRLIR